MISGKPELSFAQKAKRAIENMRRKSPREQVEFMLRAKLITHEEAERAFARIEAEERAKEGEAGAA